MLIKDYLNFDQQLFRRGGLETNCFGKIEHLTEIFPADSFAEILCVHVIEHFYIFEVRKFLEDIFRVTAPGGKAIMEGPCLLGTIDMYRKDGPKVLSQHIYGDPKHNLRWGPTWSHKWGWTKETVAEAMADVGFDIVHTGYGLRHGMGKRDFRVEGVKPK
jgi:ubiquinone/menaquinone biosynthesis C-methylase UbiE